MFWRFAGDATVDCGYFQNAERNMKAALDGRRLGSAVPSSVPSNWVRRVERHARKTQIVLEENRGEQKGSESGWVGLGVAGVPEV